MARAPHAAPPAMRQDTPALRERGARGVRGSAARAALLIALVPGAAGLADVAASAAETDGGAPARRDPPFVGWQEGHRHRCDDPRLCAAVLAGDIEGFDARVKEIRTEKLRAAAAAASGAQQQGCLPWLNRRLICLWRRLKGVRVELDEVKCDRYGNGLAHVAAFAGQGGLVERLSWAMKVVDIANVRGDTPLHVVAQRCDLATALALLERAPRNEGVFRLDDYSVYSMNLVFPIMGINRVNCKGDTALNLADKCRGAEGHELRRILQAHGA